mgnify:CR=1 FL=1
MDYGRLLILSVKLILNPKTLQKMVKIVSAVTKFIENNEEYVRVYYIDGEIKVFGAFEWQALVKEGKDLWDSHQGEVSQIQEDLKKNPERFDG